MNKQTKPWTKEYNSWLKITRVNWNKNKTISRRCKRYLKIRFLNIDKRRSICSMRISLWRVVITCWGIRFRTKMQSSGLKLRRFLMWRESLKRWEKNTLIKSTIWWRKGKKDHRSLIWGHRDPWVQAWKTVVRWLQDPTLHLLSRSPSPISLLVSCQ